MKAGSRLSGYGPGTGPGAGGTGQGGGGTLQPGFDYGGRPGVAGGIGNRSNSWYTAMRARIKKTGYVRDQPLQTNLTAWSTKDLVARELALEDMARTTRSAMAKTNRAGTVDFADQLSLTNYYNSVLGSLSATRNEMLSRGITKVATKIGA